MGTSKSYFNVQQVLDAAVQLAMSDPRYEVAVKECALDYQSVSSGIKDDQLKLCEFDVIGYVEYGSSEGIYGNVQFYGHWNPQQRGEPMGSRMHVYTLKTLRTDKESYLAMGMLVNLICYYANEFVCTHLNRFD